jgi:hypothetical protein
VKAVQAAASAKASNILHRIEGRAFLANPDEFLHGLHLLVPPGKVSLTKGFPHQFREGSFSSPSARVKSVPEIVIEVQLRSPHNV